MSDHPDRLTLLAYVDRATPVDREVIAAHLGDCSECRRALHELQQSLLFLTEGDVFAFLSARDDEQERAQLLRELIEAEQSTAVEDADAEECFSALRQRPLRSWDSAARAHPEYRTLALIRRILREVEREMDRRPSHALDLVSFAARWVHGDDAAARITLGDVWKQRSNALRHLGCYPPALEAAEMAEVFYESVPGSEFDIGQARYTSAVVFIKMNRYDDALARSIVRKNSSARSANPFPSRRRTCSAPASFSNKATSFRRRRVGVERFRRLNAWGMTRNWRESGPTSRSVGAPPAPTTRR